MLTLVREHGRTFAMGVAAISPICVAAAPIGLVWGALAAERGLGRLEVGLMSASVFAGASQFVAIGLWADPLPVAAVLLATLMVNLRHLMMSASLGRRMGRFSRSQRLLAFYGLTDETWALAETRAAEAELTPGYYAGLALPLLLTWTSSSVAGAAFGRLLGDPAALGLDFVFTAMFIALVVGFRRAPAWLPVVLASALVAASTSRLLPSPWFVLAGAAAGMAVAALRAPARTLNARTA